MRLDLGCGKDRLNLKDFLPAHLGGSEDNFWNRLLAGPYEKDVVNFYQEHAPYDISVDIGAGIGYHARKLAKLSKKVIAIEPVNDLVDMPDNVEVHKVAVGRKNGVREIGIFDREMAEKVGGHLNASFSKVRESRRLKEVRVVPLDEIVTEADFLKIDVEGYELEVLEPSSILTQVYHFFGSQSR